MNTTRSMAVPMIWIIALAIFSGCQEDRVNNIPGGATSVDFRECPVDVHSHHGWHRLGI